MRRRPFSDSIYIQFLTRYLLLALVPLALALTIAVNYSINYERNKYSENNNMTDSIRASIRMNRDAIAKTTRSLLSSRELTSFLEDDYIISTDYDTYLTRIGTYMQATINANPQYTIRIYMRNKTIPMSMDVFYHLADIETVGPIHAFLDSDAIEAWLSREDFTDTDNTYLLPVAGQFLYLHKIYDYRRTFLGLLALAVPEEYMLSYDSTQDSAILAGHHARIFNLTGDALPDDFSDLQNVLPLKSESVVQGDVRSFLWTRAVQEEFPFSIVVVTRTSDYRVILWCVFLLLFLFIIAATLLGLRSVRKIVGQMHQCLNAMDISINDNYRTRIPVTGNNEISDISRRINLLLTQASELSRRNVEQETSNKESQLIALQHQINPHFIYNTMEVFSSRMKLRGQYEESDAMIAFANMFRYNISTTDALVPLARELRQIEDYLRIQRLRSSAPILRTDIAPQHIETAIPKFTLQPIIENAISHGFEGGSRKLFLSISTKQEGSSLRIQVTDNGKGMPEDEIAELNRRFLDTDAQTSPRSDGRSVGLANINLRLRLYFGEAHHLTLTRLPRGLAVSFTVPMV